MKVANHQGERDDQFDQPSTSSCRMHHPSLCHPQMYCQHQRPSQCNSPQLCIYKVKMHYAQFCIYVCTSSESARSRWRPSPDGWAEAAGMGAQLTERDAVEDLPRRVEQLESACACSLLPSSATTGTRRFFAAYCRVQLCHHLFWSSVILTSEFYATYISRSYQPI
jgi:hypothetical protein